MSMDIIQPAVAVADLVAVVTVLHGSRQSAEDIEDMLVVVEQMVTRSVELLVEEPVEMLEWGIVKQEQQNPGWVEGFHRHEYCRWKFLAFP